MKKRIRKLLAIGFSLLGTFLAIFVGGYWLFLRQVYFLYTDFETGVLTSRALLFYIFKIFVASTAGGGLWSICDIIASFFRDDPKE